MENIAKNINILGAFCGKRDVPELTSEALRHAYGMERADVFVLFGGSILRGGEVLAEAMRRGIAKTYVIVGGEGHTTETLRRKMHQAFPEIETEDLPEAEQTQSQEQPKQTAPTRGRAKAPQPTGYQPISEENLNAMVAKYMKGIPSKTGVDYRTAWIDFTHASPAEYHIFDDKVDQYR